MHFENFTFSEEDQLQAPAVIAFNIDRVPPSSFQDIELIKSEG